MTNYILKINLDETLQWFVLGDDGRVLESHEYADYSELPQLEAKQKLVVLLPGQDVYVEQMQLPKTSRQNLLKAVPFMLEEKVVGNVANLHISVSKIADSDKHLVAAIDRDKFTKVFDRLRASGLRPVAILPDFMAWPSQAEGWAMFAVGDSIVVRTGDYTGFTITKDYFQLALHRALANTDLEKPIDCLVSGDALMHYQEDFSDSLSFFPQPQKDVLDSAIFSDKPVINFLSGQYRLKKPAKETRSYWRYVRYAFIAWLVILFAGKFVEWGVYHHQQKKLQSQITKTLNKVLPAAATSDDPKSLIEHEMQRMASQKKQDPFISILANVGSVLKQFPGAGLQTLNFSDNMLDIKLQAKELSVLESFSRALEQHHLVIKQNQVSTGTKSVIGEIKVGRA